MFTKSVAACALGGVLIGTTLPGNPLVGDTQAQQRPHSDEGKVRKGDAVRQKQTPEGVGDRLGTFSVTAYTHYRNPRGGLNATATGTLPKVGRTVAVDPRIIPLGSRIYIAGIGERIAEDTGGKIKGKKLDLFLPSVQACLQFGIQKYEVHILAQE
ncbi:MAG: 3D domain-containing protein [Candidatus Binatia bacterium]